MDTFLKSSVDHIVPYRIAALQIVLALCIGVVLLPALGTVAAISAVIAGGISALSTWYTGSKVFNSRARNAQQFVHNIYLAQVMKLLLLIALFCIVFSSMQVNFVVFIGAYAATLVVYAWALAVNLRTARG